MSENRRPLDGVRVLDLATMIAAPFCASILAEFGAEVIKVEEPSKGDPFRNFGTMTRAGSTLNFLNEARNKKSITLDLRQPEGVQILKELVAHCDLVVENFRAGTLEKWGLGYDVLKAIKPDVILVRISAYGQDGPYRHKPGYARVAHAYAGLSYLAGEPDGKPVVPGSTSLADYIAGLYAAIGALLAVVERNHSGTGQTVDVSLYEGVFRMLDELAPAYAKNGFVRERMGADTVNAVPHSHYQTRDGRWLALACSTDKMFARLARTMNRLDLLEPDNYGSVDKRVAHRDDVNKLVGEWIGTHDCETILALCEKGDVPIGPLNSIADIFEDPQFKARKSMVTLNHPLEGPVVVPNVIARLSETPGRVTTLGPKLGEHNAEVFGELLGISNASLADLKRAGTI